jgi:hypothetical protein
VPEHREPVVADSGDELRVEAFVEDDVPREKEATQPIPNNERISGHSTEFHTPLI